jgi:hypothetical protein
VLPTVRFYTRRQAHYRQNFLQLEPGIADSGLEDSEAKIGRRLRAVDGCGVDTTTTQPTVEMLTSLQQFGVRRHPKNRTYYRNISSFLPMRVSSMRIDGT